MMMFSMDDVVDVKSVGLRNTTMLIEEETSMLGRIMSGNCL